MPENMLNVEKFKPGTIFNKIKLSGKAVKPLHYFVDVTVPARINAMCFDTGRLAFSEKPHVYTAGELVDSPSNTFNYFLSGLPS